MLSTYSSIYFLKSVEEKALIALKLVKNNPKYVELIPYMENVLDESHVAVEGFEAAQKRSKCFILRKTSLKNSLLKAQDACLIKHSEYIDNEYTDKAFLAIANAILAYHNFEVHCRLKMISYQKSII